MCKFDHRIVSLNIPNEARMIATIHHLPASTRVYPITPIQLYLVALVLDHTKLVKLQALP